MKTPFDDLTEENDRMSSRLICQTCRKTIERPIDGHLCEYEDMSWYDFNDPRTIMEQRDAHRAKTTPGQCGKCGSPKVCTSSKTSDKKAMVCPRCQQLK